MTGWFEGGEGYGDDRDRFLELVRLSFKENPPSGIPSDLTSVIRWAGTLLLEIEIPDLRQPGRLHAAYFPDVRAPRLHCEWSFSDLLLDDRPPASSPIATGRVDEDAALAIGWLNHQLARPLVVERWTAISDFGARTVRLGEPDEVIRKTGLSLRRILRRPPDSSIRLR